MDKIEEKEISASKEYSFNIENCSFSLFCNEIIPREEKYVKMYSHSFCVMILVKKGRMRLLLEGKDVVMKAHDIAIISNGVRHMTVFDTPETESACVAFSFMKNNLETGNDLYKKISSLMDNPENNQYNIIQKNEYIYELLKKCTEAAFAKCAYVLNAIFYEFIVALMLEEGLIKTKENTEDMLVDSNMSRLHKINTLANVYYDRHISIEDVAKLMFLSTRQANRIIQNHFGCSWRELVTQKRMQVAMDLLKTTEMSVEEISEYVGYESTRGFYSSFKKSYKNPPSSYRKKI